MMINRFILMILIIVLPTVILAQSVGIGTPTPHPAAKLDVSSTTQGFLPPRMTTVQRNAISNKVAGLLIYNTTTGCVEMYNGASWLNLCSSLPSSVLVKSLLGGDQNDMGSAIQQTADGGYIIGAVTASSQSGDVTEASNGELDCWIVKLDSTGHIMWNRVLGGSNYDDLKNIKPTSDGGYIFCATTASSESGDIGATNKGQFDCWIVKLDANGDTSWTVLLGGDQADFAASIAQTADGGYIFGGYTQSSDNGDVTNVSNGFSDYWVVKLSAAGVPQWDKLFGGTEDDQLYDIAQTSDGGYVAAGWTTSSATGDVTGTLKGFHDFWVIKLNASGGLTWNKSIGGTVDQFGYSVKQTTDGGYIVAGESVSSTGGDITDASNGQQDLLVIKLNAAGNIVWNKLLGGSGDEGGGYVQQTTDGGYIVTGKSFSSMSGDITQEGRGLEDVCIFKLDEFGNLSWSKLYGGNNADIATAVQQTSDGGYIISGNTLSSANGSVIGVNHGFEDVWVLKLDAAGNIY